MALIGPRFVNWPIANSKYNKGIPQNIITIKYGIKNIPVKKEIKLTSLIVYLLLKNKYKPMQICVKYYQYYILKYIMCNM